MIKIKNLLPSLKERKRYILYKTNKKMDKEDIDSSLKSFMGELGIAKSGLKFIKHENEKGIIQVNHKFVDEVKTGLALIYRPDLMIRTVRVSGTLKNLNID
ncbi:MAG: Rpp14/Pop5 family protein [Nanoarchaeota archaeon]